MPIDSQDWNWNRPSGPPPLRDSEPEQPPRRGIRSNFAGGVGQFDWRDFEPGMVEAGHAVPLTEELETYRDHVEGWFDLRGQFVVIKGRDVIGVYPDRDDAIREALDRFGAEPVLIKEIGIIEEVREVGHTAPVPEPGSVAR